MSEPTDLPEPELPPLSMSQSQIPPPPAEPPLPAPAPAQPPPPSPLKLAQTAAPASVALPSAPSAIWSLVLGIMSFVCLGLFAAIPAIICGHVGRSAVRKSNGTLGGMGMATAGLVLGYVALALNLILIPVIAIPAIMKARQEMREAISGKQTVASDGHSRFTIPGSWSELPDLKQGASVQAGNRTDGDFMIVLSEPKADLGDFTLQKHHQVTRDAMKKNLKNAVATDPISLTIDGKPALQDEISGTDNGINVVFLHTTVDDTDYYHQILIWTAKSRWPQMKDEFRKTAASFRSGEEH